MRIFIFLFILTFTLFAKERIISLSPSITEILFALGHGEEVVGTSAFSLHPAKAQEIAIIGGASNPNIEKIISLKPTIVFGQSYNHEILKKLQFFDIKTSSIKLKTINDIKNSISTVANLLNSDASELIYEIDKALENTDKNQNPHSVMIVYGLHEDLRRAIYIAGKDIFFDDIIMACGNTNAYTSTLTTQPVLNYENIIAINPDQIIILHAHATGANTDVEKALQEWYKIPTNASKHKRISVIDEDYLHIPSHRVAFTIKRLCKEMSY